MHPLDARADRDWLKGKMKFSSLSWQPIEPISKKSLASSNEFNGFFFVLLKLCSNKNAF